MVENVIADMIGLLVGVCFGGIHCLDFFIPNSHGVVTLANIECRYPLA